MKSNKKSQNTSSQTEGTIDEIKDLDIEINHLRNVFLTLIQAYTLGVESEMAQLLNPIREVLETGKSRMTRNQQKILREMITLIRRVEIRPEKGKRKDLKKIERLLANLQGLVEKWQWKE